MPPRNSAAARIDVVKRAGRLILTSGGQEWFDRTAYAAERVATPARRR